MLIKQELDLMNFATPTSMDKREETTVTRDKISHQVHRCCHEFYGLIVVTIELIQGSGTVGDALISGLANQGGCRSPEGSSQLSLALPRWGLHSLKISIP